MEGPQIGGEKKNHYTAASESSPIQVLMFFLLQQ